MNNAYIFSCGEDMKLNSRNGNMLCSIRKLQIQRTIIDDNIY